MQDLNDFTGQFAQISNHVSNSIRQYSILLYKFEVLILNLSIVLNLSISWIVIIILAFWSLKGDSKLIKFTFRWVFCLFLILKLIGTTSLISVFYKINSQLYGI